MSSFGDNFLGAVLALVFGLMLLVAAVLFAGQNNDPSWVDGMLFGIMFFLGASLCVGSLYLVAEDASQRTVDRLTGELHLMADEAEEEEEAVQEEKKQQQKKFIYWAGFLLLVFLSFVKDSDHSS